VLLERVSQGSRGPEVLCYFHLDVRPGFGRDVELEGVGVGLSDLNDLLEGRSVNLHINTRKDTLRLAGAALHFHQHAWRRCVPQVKRREHGSSLGLGGVDRGYIYHLCCSFSFVEGDLAVNELALDAVEGVEEDKNHLLVDYVNFLLWLVLLHGHDSLVQD